MDCEFIRHERMEYKSKKEGVISHPNEYLSLVIDGAHQFALLLPQFTVKTREQGGLRVKVHLRGILRHG